MNIYIEMASEYLRRGMQDAIILRIGRDNYDEIVSRGDYYFLLMGRIPEDIPEKTMMELWSVVCICVSRMYWYTLKNRAGVG